MRAGSESGLTQGFPVEYYLMRMEAGAERQPVASVASLASIAGRPCPVACSWPGHPPFRQRHWHAAALGAQWEPGCPDLQRHSYLQVQLQGAYAPGCVQPVCDAGKESSCPGDLQAQLQAPGCPTCSPRSPSAVPEYLCLWLHAGSDTVAFGSCYTMFDASA